MAAKTKKNGKNKAYTGCGAYGNKKNAKKTINKNIRAYIIPDPEPRNPYDEWDTAGTQLYKEPRSYYNRFRGRKGETLDDFCNKNFNIDTFEQMDFANEDEMCEYLKHFGCLAVPLYGDRYGGFNGLAVIGQEGMKKEGWKSMKDARPRIIGEAKEYQLAAEGEVYGYVITDDEDDSIQEPFDPKLVYEYRDIVGEDVDSTWGYYGYDYVKEDAKDAWDWAIKKKQERLAKEARMPPQDRRYTVTKTGVHTPKNARAQLGGMKVGDTITLKDGTKITRTANRKPLGKKTRAPARKPYTGYRR